MRVAVLEIPARFDRREESLADIDDLLRDAGAVDLAVLPEASITGYLSEALDADLSRFAEPIDGPTARAIAELARRHRVHLVAPCIESDAARAYNTTLVVAPDGALVCRYRKRHPWYVETWATPGEAPTPLVTIAGRALALAVCFDVHFLADESAAQLAAADALIFPSAWVEENDSRAGMFAELARRFDVAIVNANWGVGAPRVRGQGSSMIVGRDGAIVAVAARGEGARVVVAAI